MSNLDLIKSDPTSPISTPATSTVKIGRSKRRKKKIESQIVVMCGKNLDIRIRYSIKMDPCAKGAKTID